MKIFKSLSRDIAAADIHAAKSYLLDVNPQLATLELESISKGEFFYDGYENPKDWTEGSYNGYLRFFSNGRDEQFYVKIARKLDEILWIRAK